MNLFDNEAGQFDQNDVSTPSFVDTNDPTP